MNRAGAFLLAPVPAAILGTAVSGATGAWPRPVSLFVFYLLLIYAAQLLFGLAIRLFLLRTKRASALGFALGGVIMIALPAIPYLIWAVGKHPHQLRSVPILLTLWLVCGGLTGVSYWFLTRPKEPAADAR